MNSSENRGRRANASPKPQPELPRISAAINDSTGDQAKQGFAVEIGFALILAGLVVMAGVIAAERRDCARTREECASIADHIAENVDDLGLGEQGRDTAIVIAMWIAAGIRQGLSVRD